uniref:Septin-type G domain-containing protein n=1 Tax=Timspurckia oligopyrenoides TaxID=708627 RepID=A0A7S0ZJ41_9RHOD|mmetsp:Transcript_7/g.12  ORF Transcript_7/g.12 Transcript_7/m.12 type:complete len:335 (+) Transcript_7:78-1082(+)
MDPSDFPKLTGVRAGLMSRKSHDLMSKGEAITILCVGESGLGKSTLVNNLFSLDVEKSAAESVLPTLHMVEKEVKFLVDEVPFSLKLVDSPGFGDTLDIEYSFNTITHYLDDQFEKMLSDEMSVRRLEKTRTFAGVDVVLYFIAPHRLKGLDIALLKRLHHRASIIPVLAKADTMTEEERMEFKQVVKQNLATNGIEYFHEPLCVICSPSAVISKVNGAVVLGRDYEWGTAESELHSDLKELRSIIIGEGLEDLRSRKASLYEHYRQRKIIARNRSILGRVFKIGFNIALGTALVLFVQNGGLEMIAKQLEELNKKVANKKLIKNSDGKNSKRK